MKILDRIESMINRQIVEIECADNIYEKKDMAEKLADLIEMQKQLTAWHHIKNDIKVYKDTVYIRNNLYIHKDYHIKKFNALRRTIKND